MPVIVPRLRLPSAAAHLTAILAVLALLAGCGSGLKGARASDVTGEASCPETVMTTLGASYSEDLPRGRLKRTDAHRRTSDRALAPASPGDRNREPGGGSGGGRELLHTGHMTNLKVIAAKRTLVDVGGAALTPLQGVIRNASGRPIATYKTSVWADRGFASEAAGVTEGVIAVRSGSHSLGGTLSLPAGPLRDEGTLTLHGVSYQYVSFPAKSFPAGAVRIYLLRGAPRSRRSAGRAAEDTLVNTLSHIARRSTRARSARGRWSRSAVSRGIPAPACGRRPPRPLRHPQAVDSAAAPSRRACASWPPGPARR